MAGLAAHHLLFKHGEWHMKAPFILYAHSIMALLVLLAIELNDPHTSHLRAIFTAMKSMFTYLLALFSSIALYRSCFHRLNAFPGPRLAAVSKIWHVLRCAQTNSQNHLILDDLFKTYGPIVRTGPTELTIFDPDIFALMDGPSNQCKKAVWYDFLLPEVAVNTTRSKPLHDQRRRIWDKAFTPKAMKYYSHRINRYAERLESIIGEYAAKGEEANLTEWFYWFSFDVMGEFAFARSFEMLETERWHHAVILLRRAMGLIGLFSPVPWLAQIAFHFIPNYWVIKDWYDMVRWCKMRMGERIEIEDPLTDVSSHLIDASKAKGTLDQDRAFLNGDSIAIIIAGSDTVAPTMVFLFYELALNPKYVDMIYHEIRDIELSDYDQLKSCDCLNGCINETLRLHPPVPSGGYRETPPEGVKLGDTYIPGGVTIIAPRYTIGRLESCFDEPERFYPERWYDKVDMVRNRKAFMPFAQGRYSCVGKNLALAELRYVTSLLLKKYTISFAPGKLNDGVERDMKDQFTAVPGTLKLKFTAR